MVDFVSLFTGMSERDIGYLLKTLVQDSINSQLTNAEISDIDEKTSVLITNSKDVELMNDISIQTAINIEPSTVYLMPEEPDGVNLKLWLKFQNAGALRDWSYQKNISYSTGANTMPGLFSRYNDHSMLKYELFSYFNGNTHYAYTVDSPTVRILPNITAGKTTSFFMRLVPVSLAKVLYAENNALFTKVDDDQLRYGYSVTIDLRGNMHFYVRKDYVQYHLFIKDAYNYILSDPLYDSRANFRLENFSKKNFLTGYEYLCGLVASEPPFHDWFFKYNPTTNNMSVINTTQNNIATVKADTSLVTAPYLELPLQEGQYTHLGTVQTTVYDNSGHAANGTISNLLTGGSWNDDNTLTSNGLATNNLEIAFGSISPINTLTEFTIAFWFNPGNDLVTTGVRELVNKGFTVANSFRIFRDSGQNNIRFVIYNTGSGDFKNATFPNAFPIDNTWYFIVAKWKTGEGVKISVNNAASVNSAVLSMTVTNSSDNLRIFRTTDGAKGTISLFKFYTTQISQTVQDNLYYEGYHNPLFPKSENIQPVASGSPPPVFVPFTNVYTLDKMTSPVPALADYRRINSLSGDNPFIQRYAVADGTSSVDPELNPYTIADGSTGGGGVLPFTRIGAAPATINSTDNSAGKVGAGENEAYTVQLFSVSSGIGQTINGKIITQAIFWMRRPVSSVTGTLYCRIWNTGATLTPVATIGSMAASAVTAGSSGSDWLPYTFTNTANTVAMAANFRIGIEYQGYGGDDVIDIQRTTSPDATAYQNTYDSNWDSDGDNRFAAHCDLYTGGTGAAATEPNIIMKSGSYNRVQEGFGVSDPLMTKIIGKVTLRLKKVGSPTGIATIALVNNATPMVIKATIGTINVATDLTTTTQDITRTNYTHGIPVASGDRIAILWTPSATGEVHVMTNLGNTTSNNWQTNTSYVLKYISSYVADTAVDLAGKIYTGGNNFDAWLRFSTTTTRITVKAVNSSSSIHNRHITKVVVRAKKFGTPAGIINCYIRDSTDAVKVTFSSVDASVLSTSYTDIEFTNVVHTYLMNFATGSADKISVEFAGATATNYVELIVNRDVLDTVNTIAQIYDSGNYVDKAQLDVSGKMYEGGEPDLNSRTRVVQSIEHQNSRLKSAKLTRIKAFLYRTLVATGGGTVYCNIRRGTDDSLVKTIGFVGLSSLSTDVAAPSEITFTDITNNYPLNVGDKVSIEFSGGSTTDQLGVLVREVTPNYDLSNSYIRKFDEVDYDDSEPTKDLCATMDEGGFFFTPEPGSIPDPTPTNIKDLLYCAGNNAKSGFFETFLMEFRIYAKNITLANADDLYNNRYSISPIGNNQILMPFSLKMNTLDPV